MALGPAKPVFDRMDLASATTSKLYAQGGGIAAWCGWSHRDGGFTCLVVHLGRRKRPLHKHRHSNRR
ncbi:hypothetical protein ADK82_20075 [Streptomyces sp. NRRL S-4]|nr:hypothetical protein ADK82_20075 [Streptomyces sp. NRRL S-4]